MLPGRRDLSAGGWDCHLLCGAKKYVSAGTGSAKMGKGVGGGTARGFYRNTETGVNDVF